MAAIMAKSVIISPKEGGGRNICWCTANVNHFVAAAFSSRPSPPLRHPHYLLYEKYHPETVNIRCTTKSIPGGTFLSYTESSSPLRLDPNFSFNFFHSIKILPNSRS